jgi:hypothetical protein
MTSFVRLADNEHRERSSDGELWDIFHLDTGNGESNDTARLVCGRASECRFAGVVVHRRDRYLWALIGRIFIAID